MAELSHPTDVMVVDIGLPDGDGWDLISHVRASAMHARMPMVVMTGLLDSADVLNRAYDLRVRIPRQAVRARGADREDRVGAADGGSGAPAVIDEEIDRPVDRRQLRRRCSAADRAASAAWEDG